MDNKKCWTLNFKQNILSGFFIYILIKYNILLDYIIFCCYITLHINNFNNKYIKKVVYKIEIE